MPEDMDTARKVGFPLVEQSLHPPGWEPIESLDSLQVAADRWEEIGNQPAADELRRRYQTLLYILKYKPFKTGEWNLISIEFSTYETPSKYQVY